ncbi:hypothetical protein TUM3794_12380 [Shewanella colwelliana]|uniref:Uncharacterized protein n=1 Tax=Shewanella colwelliana TaxID=23 RepID=A0ABQ4NX73_SHECO|nr:hypothetical protein TUM3794_12380 [Shewanella colwelliana]
MLHAVMVLCDLTDETRLGVSGNWSNLCAIAFEADHQSIILFDDNEESLLPFTTKKTTLA